MKGRFISRGIFIAAIISIIASIPAQPLHAQQQSVEFVQYFRELQNDFIRERVYLHTDRQWYVHGDRIWFSAFVTAGPQNLPSAISSVLYVELFDPEGSLIERIPVRIESGRASGSLTFNNTEPEAGTYRIQAYTAWAKNFGESYIHKADIAVLSDEETDDTAESPNGSPDLQFFAEGGELIAGLSQRVAFKAIGNDGLSRDVSGWVFSQDRTDSVRFASEHNGMGVIENWTSEESGSFAVAEIDGEMIRTELPAPVSSGSMLRVDGNPSDFLITVRSNDPETQNGQLLLFAHVRGEIYYASLILMENGSGETAIPRMQFPSGIVHFTLLGPSGNPVSERLSFNENELDRIETDLSPDQQTYSLREEVALDIAISDGERVLIPADVSLTVFDDAYADYQQYATDIRSRLYLETELRGYIEDPGYYFSDEPEAGLHLDYLLLTQGWRSYDMDAVLQRDDITLFSLPEEGFSLTGTIKSGFRGRPLENATVAFSLDDDEENLDIVTTGPDGKFMISGLDVTGAASFVLRANNESGGDRVQIELDNQFANLENSAVPPAEELTQSYFSNTEDERGATGSVAINSLKERSQSARSGTERYLEAELFGELDEITVTGEREEVDEEEQFRRFGERPGQRVDFDEQEHLSTLPINIVLNQIPGVSVVGNQVEISTGFTNLGGSAPPSPLILVDNIETDASYLLSLSPADVKTINVFRRSVELASFGISGTGGVISVRTRRGETGYVENERGTLAGRIQGYQQPTQFYSPRYGITVPRDIEEPDERITLHWEGDLSIPETGGTLQFWTNDVPSRYRVVLQGITQTGVPFSATETFEVTD
ncbi:Plug domain-containing protein [Rhodohalobacter mucosus]|nr:Plug domain-containing protein [Rhodohalobacter mucosus]